MSMNLNKLKEYEERVERIVEDPMKIIQIIERIINLGCQDEDDNPMNTPVPEDQKVAFWEFVKYYGNYQLDRAIKFGWDIQEHKEEIIEMEEAIRKIDGFSSYDLPEGLVIKYR